MSITTRLFLEATGLVAIYMIRFFYIGSGIQWTIVVNSIFTVDGTVATLLIKDHSRTSDIRLSN